MKTYSKLDLNFNEIRILKYLLRPFFRNSKTGITRAVIKHHFKFTDSNTDYLVDNLINNELIYIGDKNDPLYHDCLVINEFGREFLKYRREQFISKLFWHALLPIIVSVITSIITVHVIS